MSSGAGYGRGWTVAGAAVIAVGVIGLLVARSAAEPPATSQAARASSAPVAPERLSVVAFNAVDAGRYLVKVTGCNDCHTPGWEESGGSVPEATWLTGLPVGFRGPWGTTYPSNLRFFVRSFTADTWVAVLRARTVRPPMPWVSLHAMSDADLRAVYEYIKSLGPAGQPTPAYVPPNEEPKTPFILFVPQMPGGAKAATATTEPAATGAAATPVVQPTSAPAP